MATLTIQSPSEAGLAASFSAAAGGGDEFAIDSDQRTFLHVKNTNGSARTVTITAQKTSYGVPGAGQLDRDDIAVVVPATTGDVLIGPINQDAFANSNGRAEVTYSATSGVTVAAIKVAKLVG